MTRTEAENKLHERGFTINAYSRNGKGDLVSIDATTDPLADPCYACSVNVDTEEFRLSYTVPKSINTLQTPKCGSFMNDSHFEKIRAKFVPQVEALHKIFGEK